MCIRYNLSLPQFPGAAQCVELFEDDNDHDGGDKDDDEGEQDDGEAGKDKIAAAAAAVATGSRL